MKVLIYRDDTIDLKLEEIVTNLARIAPQLTFTVGRQKFFLASDVVACPSTYRSLDHRIAREASSDDIVILFTEKPYDNNYFWESDGNKVIVSFYAWDHLTPLSRNNGAVFFICALLVRWLDIGQSHRRTNTGCINDFWRDKTGVHQGMLAACVCESCIEHFRSSSGLSALQQLDDVHAILDDLSAASRSGNDICEHWGAPTHKAAFDIFLCHNSADKTDVREMNNRLRGSKVKTWLDEEQLTPGRPWQELLEEQIEDVKAAGIFVGESGIGPWQSVELRSFINEFVDRKCPVIPVILKSCGSVPKLPLFLKQLTWVDFRKNDPDPYERLLWGITGKKPTT